MIQKRGGESYKNRQLKPREKKRLSKPGIGKSAPIDTSQRDKP